MYICPYCGASNGEGVKFCGNCGAAVVSDPGNQDIFGQPDRGNVYSGDARNAAQDSFDVGFTQESYSAGSEQDSYNNAGYSQDPYGNAGYSQDPYGNAGYSQDPYNNAGYSQEPYNHSGYQQDSYNNAGYSQDSYGNAGYSRDSYNNAGYSQDPYSNAGYSQDSYGNAGYSQDPYNNEGYSQNAYGSNTGSGPYADPVEPQTYGQYSYEQTNQGGYVPVQQTYGYVNPNTAGLVQRSIPLCIIFSLITCGIYALYWIYKINEGINILADEEGATSSGMVLLYSLITCGIYEFYWGYKMGERIDRIRGTQGNSNVLYLVLLLAGGLTYGITTFVALSLMQDIINKNI